RAGRDRGKGPACASPRAAVRLWMAARQIPRGPGQGRGDRSRARLLPSPSSSVPPPSGSEPGTSRFGKTLESPHIPHRDHLTFPPRISRQRRSVTPPPPGAGAVFLFFLWGGGVGVGGPPPPPRWGGVLFFRGPPPAAPPPADPGEFFEKQVRPILAAQCYACH